MFFKTDTEENDFDRFSISIIFLEPDFKVLMGRSFFNT
jgi:hypothetical protein